MLPDLLAARLDDLIEAVREQNRLLSDVREKVAAHDASDTMRHQGMDQRHETLEALVRANHTLVMGDVQHLKTSVRPLENTHAQIKPMVVVFGFILSSIVSSGIALLANHLSH